MLKKRKRVDDAHSTRNKKPFACDFEGCDYTCTRSDRLATHKRTHTGEKPFTCDFEGCGKSFSDSGNLAMHKRTHAAEKPFTCDFEGCTYTCTTSGNMATHKRTHTGEKPFTCDFEGCTYTCTTSGNMATHKRTHTGEKPFTCDFAGCTYTCTTSGHLKTHKRTHTGEKPFTCEFEGCKYTFTNSGDLTKHKRTHTGEKPFTCDFEGCSYACTQSGTLTTHKLAMHTKEGAKRQLKQQMRVVNLLKEAGYAIDEECTIQYAGCVPDPDRHRARLDIYVVTITSCIIIVEVDEEAHAGYLVSCEITRMLQVHEAILARGYTVPVVFVRYNPNGDITMDGKSIRVKRKEREALLLEFLEMVRNGQHIFQDPLNLVYLCYPTNYGLPTVCEDPDFDEGMIATIRYCV
jgi:uncharacterized Zn-finger protein